MVRGTTRCYPAPWAIWRANKIERSSLRGCACIPENLSCLLFPLFLPFSQLNTIIEQRFFCRCPVTDAFQGMHVSAKTPSWAGPASSTIHQLGTPVINRSQPLPDILDHKKILCLLNEHSDHISSSAIYTSSHLSQQLYVKYQHVKPLGTLPPWQPRQLRPLLLLENDVRLQLSVTHSLFLNTSTSPHPPPEHFSNPPYTDKTKITTIPLLHYRALP